MSFISGIYSGILAWPSRLRSGSAHWDLALAVEVRQCTRGWGPAVPTDIWSSRLRSGSAYWSLELAVEDEEEEKATLIESRDPHLAGGEKIKINQETSRDFKHWETPLFNSSQQSKHHTLHGCFSSRQLLRSGAKLWSPEPLPETAALDQQGKCMQMRSGYQWMLVGHWWILYWITCNLIPRTTEAFPLAPAKHQHRSPLFHYAWSPSVCSFTDLNNGDQLWAGLDYFSIFLLKHVQYPPAEYETFSPLPWLLWQECLHYTATCCSTILNMPHYARQCSTSTAVM